MLKAQYDIPLSEPTRDVLLRKSLCVLKFAQEKYERCEEMDELALKHFAEVSLVCTPTPTLPELSLLEKVLDYYSTKKNFKRLKGSLASFPTVQMYALIGHGDSSAWGKSVADIDEQLELVMGWFWNFCSYERTHAHRKDNGNLIRVTNSPPCSRSQVAKMEIRLAPGISNRYAESTFHWFKLVKGYNGNDAFVIFWDPHDSMDGEERASLVSSNNVVTATSRGLYIFERLATRITRVTNIQNRDAGGAIPKWLMNAQIAVAMATIRIVQAKYRRANKIIDKVGLTG